MNKPSPQPRTQNTRGGDNPTTKHKQARNFIDDLILDISVSRNVWWNKDYSVETSWLLGKPVGGVAVDVAVKLSFSLGRTSVGGEKQ